MQSYYLVRKSKEDSNMMTKENQWNQQFQGKKLEEDLT